jgi:hypothetical protein
MLAAASYGEIQDTIHEGSLIDDEYEEINRSQRADDHAYTCA